MLSLELLRSSFRREWVLWALASSVFYEISPISCQDNDGHGKSDVPALIRRLDLRLPWSGQ